MRADEPMLISAGKIFTTIRSEGLLSAGCAEQICRLIQSGALKRGERLPSERKLCELLGVSRTVVREALKMLRASGLVWARQGIGVFVAEMPANILASPMSYFA